MAPSAQPHAIMVPWPSDGHINGLMRLGQFLASQGLLVTFAFPARPYSLLQLRNPSQHHDSAVRIEILPDGLPTEEHHLPSFQQKLASAGIMQEGLQQLIEKLKYEHPVSCIVSDTFVPWTQDLADKFEIPRVDFWTSTVTVYSICLHIPQLISKGYLPLKGPIDNWNEDKSLVDFIPGLSPFPITELPKEFLVEDLSNPMFQFFVHAFSRARDAERILVHSFYELEGSVFDALRADQIPVYSVGPLFDPPLSVKQGASCEATLPSLLPAEDKCLRWLDKRAVSSVIYVSFGTIASLSAEETQEMALGLEASQYHFIWVIRSNSIKGELSDVLPDGFLSRTKERSLIISWAPQPAVLAHPSVGGFLTHCGWNSTLESLWTGVPMVACPRAAEQRSNARLIANKWKVGLVLERKGDGSFTKEAVKRAVRKILEGEEGKEARRRACELREAARKAVADGGLSKRNLQKFAEDMN